MEVEERLESIMEGGEGDVRCVTWKCGEMSRWLGCLGLVFLVGR